MISEVFSVRWLLHVLAGVINNLVETFLSIFLNKTSMILCRDFKISLD